MSKYVSTLPRPTSDNFYLDPAELRKLAVGMPARPAFMDSVLCSQNEYTYLSSVMDIFYKGSAKWSRPNGGLWTLMYDEGSYVYDISDFKLPLLSTKKIFNRSWLHETIWFLRGSTDIEYLKANNVSIWDSWVKEGTGRYDKDGKLIGGNIGHGGYGAMWRKWKDIRISDKDVFGSISKEQEALEKRGFSFAYNLEAGEGSVWKRKIDQIADVIHQLKTNPDSRRIIVSAWNPDLTDETVLPPCHSWYQFISKPSDRPDGKRELTVLLTLRSNDSLLGKPFNCAQYSFLAHLIAHLTNHVAVKLVYRPNDLHIYEDQLALLPLQMQREPLECDPRLVISDRVTSIDDIKFEDFSIVGYDESCYHPSIPYPVAV